MAREARGLASGECAPLAGARQGRQMPLTAITDRMISGGVSVVVDRRGLRRAFVRAFAGARGEYQNKHEAKYNNHRRHDTDQGGVT